MPNDTTPAPIGADALREALWICVEHNALHFGETHNTVVQGRAALASAAQPAAEPAATNDCTRSHPNANMLRAIADGKQMQGRVPEDGCDWFDIYPDQAIGAIASGYSMKVRIKPDVAGAFSAGAALSTAAQPPADGALNTIAAMFHSGEEIEGPDGLAMMVDMSVWNDALDAFEGIIGDEMEPAKEQA